MLDGFSGGCWVPPARVSGVHGVVGGRGRGPAQTVQVVAADRRVVLYGARLYEWDDGLDGLRQLARTDLRARRMLAAAAAALRARLAAGLGPGEAVKAAAVERGEARAARLVLGVASLDGVFKGGTVTVQVTPSSDRLEHRSWH